MGRYGAMAPFGTLNPVSVMGGSLKDVRTLGISGTGVRDFDTGSEYAESEYADTIVSDAVTDVESLNSMSDEEVEATNDPKSKVQHLQLPANEYE